MGRNRVAFLAGLLAALGSAPPGQAAVVHDLQTLDKNHDVFSDSDPDTEGSLLDDLQVQQDVSANP